MKISQWEKNFLVVENILCEIKISQWYEYSSAQKMFLSGRKSSQKRKIFECGKGFLVW